MQVRRILALASFLVLTCAEASEFGFDRVDVVSEDPGVWLNYDLPTIGSYPIRPALRFIEQIKLVLTTPAEDLYVGLSLSSQSVVLEREIPGVAGLRWTVGVQTRALVPRGGFGGLAYRIGVFRFAAGASVASAAAWANLSWTSWSILPTVGIGIGRTSH